MKVESKGHTTIIKDTQADVVMFLAKLTHEHKSFENANLIIDISSQNGIFLKDINAFLPLSKLHRKGKKSFVIVANTDFNKASQKLMIVPTIQEAHDMIEMEEIERDLGF